MELPYAERLDNRPDVETYAEIRNRWLTPHANGYMKRAETPPFLALQNNKSFLSIVRRLVGPQINSAMAEFVHNAIRYTKSSGEVLDLFGEQNVVFDGQGNFLLVDG